MNLVEKNLGLKSISFPGGELLPGFLVPVFHSVAGDMVQCIAGDETVGDFIPINQVDGVLDIHTLNDECIAPVVIIGAGGTGIGGPAMHAFYDTQKIFLGSRVNLVALLKLRLADLNMKFREKPLSLAGMYDFIGQSSISAKLRLQKSTDFLFEDSRRSTASVGSITEARQNNRRSLQVNYFEREADDFVNFTSGRDSRSWAQASAA